MQKVYQALLLDLGTGSWELVRVTEWDLPCASQSSPALVPNAKIFQVHFPSASFGFFRAMSFHQSVWKTIAQLL